MDNDVRCPSCGAAAPLPSHTQPSSFEGPGGQPIGRVTPGKLGCGIVSLLAGGALLLLAAALYFQGEDVKLVQARPVTAAELRKIVNPESLSDPWVAYTAPKVIDTGIEIVSGRVGRKKSPKSKFLLVQVEDRWLIADVASDHSGNRLEGQLQVWDSPMYRDAMSRIRNQHPAQANGLLPYQFHAEYSYGSQGKTTQIQAALVALFGVIFVVTGLRAFFMRAPAARR